MENSAYSNLNINKKTPQNHKWLWGSAILAAVTLLVLFVCTFVLPVTVKDFVVTYELGETVSMDVDAYVEGNPLAMLVTTMDMSNVIPGMVGDYDVEVKHGWQKEVVQIKIVDTTAPDIILKPGSFYLQVGESYSADWFIDETYDESGAVDLKITLDMGPNAGGDKIGCGSVGERRIKITATDNYGNASICLLNAVADTAPEITGCKEYYVAQGSNVVFSTEDIYVYDEADGDLSDELEIDVSGVDVNTTGIYEVIYSATDSYGFTTDEAVKVNVMPADEVQALINNHSINRFDDCIIGAYNLYDGGVYEEDNVAHVLEEMEPAMVVVTNASGRGSGFIVKITDTDIIICTNLHVTKNNGNHTVFFHDGSFATGITVGSMDKVDVSFVRVNLEYVPKELMDTLKTVHIDNGYLESITDPEEVNVGFRTLEQDGSIWQDKEGVLVELKQEFRYQEYAEDYLHGNLHYVTQVTAPSFNGASGSAILDGHGNLIAMVSFYFYDASLNKRFYYGMTVEDILRGYKEIFGEDLNYR